MKNKCSWSVHENLKLIKLKIWLIKIIVNIKTCNIINQKNYLKYGSLSVQNSTWSVHFDEKLFVLPNLTILIKSLETKSSKSLLEVARDKLKCSEQDL